ncbi:MAG TPA: nuclear transport factor 2 family protein [Pirellulaceae bacterium]|nr:nuclear transport factor 2 family protein [Pirellulaceae bacterium]
MGLSEKSVAAINTATESCLQALRDHDPDAYLENCTDDLVFSPPGQADVAGSVSARAFLDGFPTPKNASYQYDQIEGNDDLAFARGTFTLTDENDESTSIRAVLIFRRDPGGVWRLALDIWHAD